MSEVKEQREPHGEDMGRILMEAAGNAADAVLNGEEAERSTHYILIAWPKVSGMIFPRLYSSDNDPRNIITAMKAGVKSMQKHFGLEDDE